MVCSVENLFSGKSCRIDFLRIEYEDQIEVFAQQSPGFKYDPEINLNNRNNKIPYMIMKNLSRFN